MNRFYSTLGIDQAIKNQERDNIKANNMLNSTKTWQEEFNEKFNHPNLWCDCAMEYDNERQRNEVKQFLSKAIDQTREETIESIVKYIRENLTAGESRRGDIYININNVETLGSGSFNWDNEFWDELKNNLLNNLKQ